MKIVAGAISSFLGKAIGFIAEHIWALILFVVGLIGVWLMQGVLRKVGGIRLVLVPEQAFVVGSGEYTLLWSVSCLSFVIVAKRTCLV